MSILDFLVYPAIAFFIIALALVTIIDRKSKNN